MSSPAEILEEKRRKERMYNKTSYERNKLERRHKKLAEYYERSLKRILERDEAKDKYCEDNRISMFRCCYIDMPTIEEAIEEALKYFATVEYDHINPNRAYKAHLLSIQP